MRLTRHGRIEAQHVRQGGVVFVYEHDDFLPVRLVQTLDDVVQRAPRGTVAGRRVNAQREALIEHGIAQVRAEISGVVRRYVRHIQRQDRTTRYTGQRTRCADRQALKQIVLRAGIQALQGGDQQGFAETPRPRQKYEPHLGGQHALDIRGFVYVDLPAPANGSEVGRIRGQGGGQGLAGIRHGRSRVVGSAGCLSGICAFTDPKARIDPGSEPRRL